MEVRLLKHGDEADYFKISAASFVWTFDPENVDEFSNPVYGAFDGGKLIAGAEVQTFESNFCGTLLPTIGIGGVASMPEQRRKGGVRAIFEELERLAPEKGWAMGFLYPFSVKYYAKFGYAYINRMSVLTAQFCDLTRFERNTDVTLFDGTDTQELYDLHNKCAMQYNLMTMRRDNRYFCTKPFEKCCYTYVWHYPNGEAGAYAAFKINRDIKSVVVSDLWFLDNQALCGILGFLRNYDGTAKMLVINNVPVDSPLVDVLSQVDSVKQEFGGYPAGRIYDLPAILAANRYPEERGSFVLQSVDTIAKNNGIFSVEYQNGKAAVKKCNAAPDIVLETCAAAKLLLSGRGYTAESAAYLDGVTINGDADAFFKAFPHRPTAFIEGF